MVRLIARLPGQIIQICIQIVEVLLILLTNVNVTKQEVIALAESLLNAHFEILVTLSRTERS